MKKMFFSMAFGMAILSAFAFNVRTAPVDAFYSNGSLTNCTLDHLTNESDCATGNTGVQCTIAVAGSPKAWNQPDCSDAFKRP